MNDVVDETAMQWLAKSASDVIWGNFLAETYPFRWDWVVLEGPTSLHWTTNSSIREGSSKPLSMRGFGTGIEESLIRQSSSHKSNRRPPFSLLFVTMNDNKTKWLCNFGGIPAKG